MRQRSLLLTLLVLVLTALAAAINPLVRNLEPLPLTASLLLMLALASLTLAILLRSRHPALIQHAGGYLRLINWQRSSVALSLALLWAALITTFAYVLLEETSNAAGPILAAATLLFTVMQITSSWHGLSYRVRQTMRLGLLFIWLLGLLAHISMDIDVYTSLTSVSIWALIMAPIIVYALYVRLFVHPRIPQTGGTVNAVTRPSTADIEFTLVLDQPVSVEPGQFFLVRVTKKGFEPSVHPLSVSAIGQQVLGFVVRSGKGNWSQQVYEQMAPGDRVELQGPFGELRFRFGFSDQVWVAEGIGIFPFISCLRLMADRLTQQKRPLSARERSRLGELDRAGVNEPDLPRSVQLYYSYAGKEQAAFRTQLEKWQREIPGLTVRFINTREQPRLEPDELIAGLETSVFLCGSRGENRRFVRFLHKSGKTANLIHQELN